MCAVLAALLSLYLPAKYEASATVSVSDPSGSVQVADLLSVANNVAQSIVSSDISQLNGEEVFLDEGTATNRTLTLTVKGNGASECVELVNRVASNVAVGSKDVFDALQETNEANLAELRSLNTSEDVAAVLSGTVLQDTLGSGKTFEFCTFLVNEATDAQEVGLSLSALVLIGFIVGLFLVVVVTFVVCVAKAPIISREEIERLVDSPVLNAGVSHSGDWLWANIQFLSDVPIKSVCLVPLAGASAKKCAKILENTILQTGEAPLIEEVEGDSRFVSDAGQNQLSIYCCPSLDDGVAAIYYSHIASATVICARKWDDSVRVLESVIRELSYAKANIVGIALL